MPGTTVERDAWWRDAVIYQIYPRSFADGDGDGVGDFRGITTRLDHLVDLGIDAVWLSPFYVSPQADAGYDVADYTDVDPLFGTLDDFDRFQDAARAAGLRVIVDLVPNHSSDRHPWFQTALADPDSPERARYVFRPGRGERGERPPNNWQSVFGGSAWEHTAGGDWYLHLFDRAQPDFDWSNPEVADLFDDILRFWLDRGVDGFRVDVAHGLVKREGLPDVDPARDAQGVGSDHGPMWDQDGVHDIYRRWRRILDEYGPDRILVAEAWVSPADRMARYLRPDEMQQAFNFPYMMAGWSASRQRQAIEASLEANDAVDAPTTWVLSNHDVVRHASRLGLPDPTSWPRGVGLRDPQPDSALGLRRARALTLLCLGLPGSAYIYQGEELGLPEHTELPDELRLDPSFFRTGGAEAGRDGCRIPLPWSAEGPTYGFNSTGESWLPQPAVFAELAADRQADDPDSTLSFYRRAIRVRREFDVGRGRLEWIEAEPDVLRLGRGPIEVVVNFGHEAFALPEGELVLASAFDAVVDGFLRPDSGVWIRRTST